MVVSNFADIWKLGTPEGVEPPEEYPLLPEMEDGVI